MQIYVLFRNLICLHIITFIIMFYCLSPCEQLILALDCFHYIVYVYQYESCLNSNYKIQMPSSVQHLNPVIEMNLRKTEMTISDFRQKRLYHQNFTPNLYYYSDSDNSSSTMSEYSVRDTITYHSTISPSCK